MNPPQAGRNRHTARPDPPETRRVSDADVSCGRFLVGTALVLVPLVIGVISLTFVGASGPLLVVGATPFVIVELVDKLIEFLLHGVDEKDWFQGVFQQVRVPAALMSGSFVAGTLAGKHVEASVVGLCMFATTAALIRLFRPKLAVDQSADRRTP